MNINDTFPSNYLKATDLQGREIPVTISAVEIQTIGNDQKPILFFQGKQKGVVMNKTNAMNIAAAYGPDTDGWYGKQVILFSVWTDFQGKSVQAIRIRPAQQPAQQMQAPINPAPMQQAPQQRPAVDPALDDSIPF